MINYIIRRLLWAVVLFLAVTVVTYIIFFIIPADPARAVAGKNPTPEMILRASITSDRQAVYISTCASSTPRHQDLALVHNPRVNTASARRRRRLPVFGGASVVMIALPIESITFGHDRC